MAGGLEGDVFLGPKAEEHRGLLNIRYPIEVRHISNPSEGKIVEVVLNMGLA